MLLPVDDRLATRGHGTFDVIYVKNGNIINLDAHIDRLYASSSTVEINPPLTKEKAKEKVVGVMRTIFNLYLEEKGINGKELLKD